MVSSKSIQFFKKAASHATLSFLFGIDRCKMKNVQPLALFFDGDSCYSSSVCLYETNFLYERGYSTAFDF